ncbi:AfsR/SARP family transcriptional regulator [Streptomyces ipomoeae]|uniref:Transcriptional regulatory protein, C-terminal domain protein n=1 Tax=Streptomyces ipomoeae 91-03 TaxID=698759 RepID=L1KZP8_9ACTN|nr:BTAD domain-containing putative transcriptional regulator [Streptomyces ipomoeae]EKX65808.1 transcriptional regulatory protein, C-terminal domain protein [Streptomyces ipomoeae 91-03]
MKFYILGPLRINADNGEPVALVRRKTRLLLAGLLLRHGHPVTTDELIGVLWGDAPPSSARANLHSYISTLRRHLDGQGSPVVTASRDGYGIRIAPDEFDLSAFERRVADAREAVRADRPGQAARSFAAALDLWRGDVLESLELSEPLRAQVTRLEEMRLSVQEDMMDARLSAGEHAHAVGEFKELVQAQPFREYRWGRLILALHRCGRTKEALETYQVLCSLLDTELGVGPNAELRAMQRAILANEICAPPPAHLSVRTAVGKPLWQGTRPHVTVLGRERERAELAELALEERLVTVTGPGGCGKSALALDTARVVADCFTNGVTVTAPSPTALARLVSLLDSEQADVVDEALTVGPGRRALIVLDNFDQLAPTVTSLVRRLLAHPAVTVLATSRAPLRISGEVVWSLGPLSTPVADEETAATRLFLNRAGQAMPEYRATRGDCSLAGRICRRLDGLPLALELAAARLRVLPMKALADRLDTSLDCLLVSAPPVRATRSHLARERPATLTSVFEWSYARLDEAEKLLLQRLSGFPGAFSLEDLEDPTGLPSRPPLSPSCVVSLLASLVEQSMVQSRDTPHGRRFRVLGPIRAFVAHAARESAESLEAA